jgi:hypothetical protein
MLKKAGLGLLSFVLGAGYSTAQDSQFYVQCQYDPQCHAQMIWSHQLRPVYVPPVIHSRAIRHPEMVQHHWVDEKERWCNRTNADPVRVAKCIAAQK